MWALRDDLYGKLEWPGPESFCDGQFPEKYFHILFNFWFHVLFILITQDTVYNYRVNLTMRLLAYVNPTVEREISRKKTRKKGNSMWEEEQDEQII